MFDNKTYYCVPIKRKVSDSPANGSDLIQIDAYDSHNGIPNSETQPLFRFVLLKCPFNMDPFLMSNYDINGSISPRFEAIHSD